MSLSGARRLLAAFLAAWLAAAPAAAQVRAIAASGDFAAPLAPPASFAAVGASAAASRLSATLAPAFGLSANAAPRLAPPAAPAAAAAAVSVSAPSFRAPFAAAPSAAASAPAAAAVGAQAAAALPILPAAAAEPSAPDDASAGAAAPGGNAAVPRAPASDDARLAKAEAAIEEGAASWQARAPGSSAPRSRPAAARAALAAGAVLVAAAAAAVLAPHAAIPAALSASKGYALWSGLGLLSLSRYWRAPQAAAPVPVPPASAPEGGHGTLRTFRALWANARAAADAQAALEARAGGSSRAAFRDWALGGLRAAAAWLPVTLGAMAVGAAVGKGLELAARLRLPAAGAPASVAHMTFMGMTMGPLAASLAQLSAQLLFFDLARRVLAGRVSERAATGLALGVTLAVTAAALLTLTHSPFVLLATLGADAVMLALRARAGSWLAPLALGGLFSVLSYDSARFAAWLKFGAAGAIVGLPDWTGAAVAVLLAAGLVYSAKGLRPSALLAALKAQAAAVRGLAAAPAPESGAPRSPRPLLKLAGLWGLILYALGDLSYWAVHAFAGGSEPAPAALAKLLTSPVDLVVYNFLLVGFLEEYVFRRNLFKPMRDRLAKWGASPRASFWAAAVASALIFSGAHYVDYGALLGKLGLGAATASSGLGGAYAFTWAGFTSRAVLGVALAWLYSASGMLLLPIFAHAAADTFEGLGLRWGIAPFLALAVLVLLAQGPGARLLRWIDGLKRMPPVQKAFVNSALLAAVAVAAAPILWGAAPALKGAFLLGTASVLTLAAIGVVALARAALARLFPNALPAVRRRLVAAALGIALGLGLGAAPIVAPGPFAEKITAGVDLIRRAHTEVRAVPGSALSDETLKVLSRNPVGREVLEHLRDRGGVVRLPTFFVRSSKDDGDAMVTIVAQHEGYFDGLYIGAGLLRDHGWTVDEFLSRPDLQRRVVVEFQATLAHELTHAVQSRRSPFSREPWQFESMEHEYEAYAVQNLYVHAQLQADPHAAIDSETLYEYENALDLGLVAALKAHDADYPQDRHADSPHWNALRAQISARWPALRVEGYVLLARRQPLPRLAEAYMKKARAAAAQAGLPVPTLAAPSTGDPTGVVRAAWGDPPR
jgi:membrane protease YdiL (CAAX protease family)